MNYIPHYSYNTEKFQYVRILQMWCKPLEGQIYVERERCGKVYQVNSSARELAFFGTGDESDCDFKSEPSVAHALYIKEHVVRVRVSFVQSPSVVLSWWVVTWRRGAYGDIFYDRHAHVGVSLEAKRQDGDTNEEHRHNADDLKKRKEK